MKTFHGTDNYGGVMELELYAHSTTIHSTSEICTHSLVAGDVHTERLDGLKMITGSKGLNIHTGEDASDTWEITPRGIVTSGSYGGKSTIRHKGGVMAVSSSYNTGDLYVRIDNIYIICLAMLGGSLECLFCRMKSKEVREVDTIM